MQRVMQYIVFFFLLLLSPVFSSNKGEVHSVSIISDCRQLYIDMCLDSIVNFSAFKQALTGSEMLSRKKKEIITLIDFSKPSTEKRLYILDLKKKKLLLSSYVSHGRNSGENFATSFSNKNGSYQSSLGFYITENTYYGGNGYSLVLDGLEKGINDNAKARAIVIHGADYCNPSFIASTGRLGRSYGCPALPQAISDSVIDIIKDGTLLYIYANNSNYIKQSRVFSMKM